MSTGVMAKGWETHTIRWQDLAHDQETHPRHRDGTNCNSLVLIQVLILAARPLKTSVEIGIVGKGLVVRIEKVVDLVARNTSVICQVV